MKYSSINKRKIQSIAFKSPLEAVKIPAVRCSTYKKVNITEIIKAKTPPPTVPQGQEVVRG